MPAQPGRVNVEMFPGGHSEDSSLNDGGAKVIAEVISGPHEGARFEFSRHETLLVGRADVAQLCLHKDSHFSRHHFCLEVNPPECFFRDLGSRNGTFVNGERADERRLHNGDVISGGTTQIQITIADSRQGSVSGDSSFASPSTENPDATLQPSMPSQHGETSARSVPGYELIEELGIGGMGTVYRAVQRATSKEVALKLIMPAHAVTVDSMQLFIREASVLSRLDHPRIVKFHEFGMTAGQFFLAMELVDTIELSALLERQSERSQIRIPCAVVCQVLEALSYAHAHSLVHRDIKPSNILLTKVGRKLRVKLADFGLAKNYVNAGFSAMTLEGDIRGTLAYSAPEQIIDSRYAKPASDIYAVGATLYEYLSGESPYNFTTGRSQLVTVLESEPVPLNERRENLPAELVAAVHRALAKDPSDRFSSAEEMRQALLPFS